MSVESRKLKLFTKRYSESGDPVVILHGLFGNQGNWGAHAKFLGEEYTVIGMDLRNHGRSEWEDAMSYPAFVEDVRYTMRNIGLDKAHFIGHSIGGKTAMQLALDYPDRVGKLVVVDIAPVKYKPHHQNIFAGFEALDLDYIDSRKEADEVLSEYVEDKSVRDFLLTNLLKDEEDNLSWRINMESIIENYHALLDGIDSSAVFEGDVLFIQGGKSDYIKPEHREKILALFPRAKFEIVRDAGHWVHSEKPEQFRMLVTGFLRQ